jgi:hypothetical protein
MQPVLGLKHDAKVVLPKGIEEGRLREECLLSLSWCTPAFSYTVIEIAGDAAAARPSRVMKDRLARRRVRLSEQWFAGPERLVALGTGLAQERQAEKDDDKRDYDQVLGHADDAREHLEDLEQHDDASYDQQDGQQNPSPSESHGPIRSPSA